MWSTKWANNICYVEDVELHSLLGKDLIDLLRLYFIVICSTADQLGKLYAALGQRRCEILDEDVWREHQFFRSKPASL